MLKNIRIELIKLAYSAGILDHKIWIIAGDKGWLPKRCVGLGLIERDENFIPVNVLI